MSMSSLSVLRSDKYRSRIVVWWLSHSVSAAASLSGIVSKSRLLVKKRGWWVLAWRNMSRHKIDKESINLKSCSWAVSFGGQAIRVRAVGRLPFAATKIFYSLHIDD